MHFSLSVPLSTKTVHVEFDAHYAPQEAISPYELKEAAKYAFGTMQVHVQDSVSFNLEQALNSYRAMTKPEWPAVVRENHITFNAVNHELSHVGTQLTIRAIEIERKMSHETSYVLDPELVRLEIERDDLNLQYRQVADRLHIHTALETLICRSKDFSNRLRFNFQE